ncbi:MAG TPA: hypothetical protein VFR86_10905 [Burkholderiaceae bacterium]|nr:hypothetical protein [Burkholderiaceae bacterium]
MAELLKRDYDIIALKTEIGRWSGRRGESDQVRFTLQFHADDALQDGPQWIAPLAAIAPVRELDRRNIRGPGPSFELPPHLIEGLREWFAAQTDGTRPLWVHLVKPYGVLRLVPWERLLGEALQVPILMLPDFLFPPPREALNVLDVVLCGSAPLGYEEISVGDALLQAVQRILSVSGRRVRIHVFADKVMAAHLTAQWKAEGVLSRVTVYPHAAAAPYVEEDLSSRLVDRAGTLRSPWLLWMRDALHGRSIDVVHFVCHGYLARERGALLFAQSPLERTERYLAGPVSAAELNTFLTQIGAWSTVFSSLPDNHSEPGLRALADEIAQTRPGPMMMHVMREDPGSMTLAAGYEFLYASDPHPPPRSTALFIYCQPYLAAAQFAAQRRRGARMPIEQFARNAVQHRAVESALASSPLDACFEREENVSASVASTERFAEQVQLRYQQWARDEVLAPGTLHEREMQAALDTLDRLREAVAVQEAQATGKDGAP